jgi:glycosyltransferase involved in cell wall biosynthesis
MPHRSESSRTGEPIRLLHMTTVPMTLGFVKGQVGYMKAAGIEVSALSSPGERLDAFAEEEQVPVYRVPITRRVTPVKDIIALGAVKRVFSRVRPHIVHAHSPKAGLLGMTAAALARVPVRVYHMCGLPMTTATGVRRQLLKWSEIAACAFAHQVFCVSASVRQQAIDEGLCRPEKIKVLASGSSNGVDTVKRFNPGRLDPGRREAVRARLGIAPESRVIGFVGRIVRDKGVRELIEAWAMLRDEFPDLHAIVIGPFEEQDTIGREAKARLLNDPRIHFVGVDWDVAAYYLSFDVFVLPTYREGLSDVLLEAAAMYLPTVATRVPGCVDAVKDGVTGTLVPARDPVALAQAIRCYLTNPELRRAHGEAGRARVVADFAQEPLWELVLREYARLLDRNGVTRSMLHVDARTVRAGG